MRIVLSGPPSVGKTTQGKLLAEWLRVPHVSSGMLIRDGAATGNPRAVALAELVSDGSLAPSDEIVALVFERLSAPDCAAGFILDGFPRKVLEAKCLLDTLGGVDVFVILQASSEVLQARVRERAKQTAFLRVDDDPQVFPNRIATYLRETSVVRTAMESAGVPVVVVDAEQRTDRVAAAIRLSVSAYLPLLEGESQPAFAF